MDNDDNNKRIEPTDAFSTAWVLSLGIDNKWKQDERSYMCLSRRESMKNRYGGFPNEIVWYAIVQSLEIMWDWTGSQSRDFRCGPEWENWVDRVTNLANQFWIYCSFRVSLDAML